MDKYQKNIVGPVSKADRKGLVEKPFQDFDPPASSNVDAAWAEEVESRMDAYDRGEIKASPVEDVLERLAK
jgi:putative addiction module component (TIGR02574 family)